MPAQLTATRNGDLVSTAASTAACTDVSSATSVRANSPPISAATCLPAFSFRSAMTTVAPAAASARAVASPSPLAPPETTAEVPLSSMPGAYPPRLRRLRGGVRPTGRNPRTFGFKVGTMTKLRENPGTRYPRRSCDEVPRQPLGSVAGRLARVPYDPAGFDDCQHCDPEPDH